MFFSLFYGTFVGARHPIGSSCVDDFPSDDVGKDTHWLMRPIVFFEYLAITDWSPICHQHNSLVALRPLRRPIILYINN